MKVDDEEIKAGNFKFEETPFYEFSKLMFNEERDYTELNKRIMDDYNEVSDEDSILHIVGDYEIEQLMCYMGSMHYTILIESNEVDKDDVFYQS